MPTIFSGVENRIFEARERHQELHRTTRQDVAEWRTQAKRLTIAVNALNEANEALDAKANAALALSVLAATASLIALKRR
ncbi:hypothetical protein [Rothia sp. P3C3.S176]|uniref:hypothetical protein n=1 Tax=Rothia sp. P3C3.S176 TaxID=2962204 RepID=UPI0020C84B6B|nr:hypothetical protein [Rothia sp. P3C3.S176]MCP8995039.1 hypothetical protein [Rothia sp. P3C3.S176]